jgi:S-adenosylmethionine decarboxylase
MLDGYGADASLLDSMDGVFSCLEQLPAKLHMHTITTPYVVRVGGNETKDPGGLSGFVMIAESHISIHTFPADRFVSIDVYTCQNQLDSQAVIAYFTEAFKLEETETNEVIRGKRWGQLAARFR